MRTIYVDDKGVCNTNVPIEEDEIVSVNICNKLEFEVLGTLNDTESPCSTCPLGDAYAMQIIPRCPRIQSYAQKSSDDYDSYDYLCTCIYPIKISDVMEDL